jgi:hypothetical protein
MFIDPRSSCVAEIGSDRPGGFAAVRPRSGSTFPLGMTTVNCTATNKGDGVKTTGSFTVTVTDTTPPVVRLPHDKVREATGPGGSFPVDVTK